MSTDTEALARLSDTLESLRGAVLSGDLDALGAMLEALGPTVDRLEAGLAAPPRPDPALKEALLTLRDRAARLGPVIAAARAGVEDARALMRGLARADQSSTYDSSGHRRTLATVGVGLARRA